MLDRSAGERQQQQPTAGSAAHQAHKRSNSKPQLANGAVTSASLHHFQCVAYELHMYGTIENRYVQTAGCSAGSVHSVNRAAAEVSTLSDTEQMPVSHRSYLNDKPFPNCRNAALTASHISPIVLVSLLSFFLSFSFHSSKLSTIGQAVYKRQGTTTPLSLWLY